MEHILRNVEIVKIPDINGERIRPLNFISHLSIKLIRFEPTTQKTRRF